VASSNRLNKWVIRLNNSFQWLIHSRMRQLFMNGSFNLCLNRFIQNAESFSNENKAECCPMVLLWSLFETIFAAKIEQKQSMFLLKCKWLNINYLLTEQLYEISVTFFYRYSSLFRKTAFLVVWFCVPVSSYKNFFLCVLRSCFHFSSKWCASLNVATLLSSLHYTAYYYPLWIAT